MTDDTAGPADWFLCPAERGNDATGIDRDRGGATAWTEGNRVHVVIDGREYFARLHDVLCSLGHGDMFNFAAWEGDADERLSDATTEVGRLLEAAARRGVQVRGLLWRSHPREAHFSEEANIGLSSAVNRAGGEVLLDERVRRAGSHHQKFVFIHRATSAADDVAFAGGIDLCHGRNDTPEHAGDPQPVEIDKRYGACPPWHDVQLELRGPVIGDVAHSFWERWEDPMPLDHRNPIRMLLRLATKQHRRPEPLTVPRREQPLRGPHAVQVLRTYPAKRPGYPFAPAGERSIARAYLKAFRRARRLVYLEDQYFWSLSAARALADALRANPSLRVVVVVPRYPDEDGAITGPANRIGRQRVTEELVRAGGDRVLICDLENAHGTPIYVHAKVCVVDDVWMTVGSDNLNRRSWTHDSELCCAVIDTTTDSREPRDPAGLGDCARQLARDTRLRLWREHLGRTQDDDGDLVDPDGGFAAFVRAAQALEAWHRAGRRGDRPAGHVRLHRPEAVTRTQAALAESVYRLLVDPDGRPRRLRRSDAF